MDKLAAAQSGIYADAFLTIESNMKAYQNPYGMTAEQAYAKYGSWQGVIDAAFRSNATINAILGLGG